MKHMYVSFLCPDKYELLRHGGEDYHESIPPQAIVMPLTTLATSNIARICMERIVTLSDRLVQRTLAVGGTCTGEHGIGYGKIKYLIQQYSEGTIGMMRHIKKALDPLNLMNLGKVLPA